MGGSLNKKQREQAKVEELAANDSSGIEDEINNKLKDGWTYNGSIVKGNKVYLVFLR